MKSFIFFSFYLPLLSVTTVSTDPISENDNYVYIYVCVCVCVPSLYLSPGMPNSEAPGARLG